MRKSHARQLLAIAALAMGFFFVSNSFAQVAAVGKVVPAPNCAYTGNSADVCYASDGTNNLKITHCKPGETSCGYEVNPGPIVVVSAD